MPESLAAISSLAPSRRADMSSILCLRILFITPWKIDSHPASVCQSLCIYILFLPTQVEIIRPDTEVGEGRMSDVSKWDEFISLPHKISELPAN